MSDPFAAFWLEFDNFFSLSTPRADVREARVRMYEFGNKTKVRLPYRWRVMAREVEDKRPYAEAWKGFITFAEEHRGDVELLADLQLQLMDGHFAGRPADLRTAFVLLGSGTLNRPDGSQHVINQAELAAAKSLYTVWFAFARAASRLATRKPEWIRLATFIGLACNVHVRLRPNDVGTNTALLDGPTLADLVRTWQADAQVINEERLDQEFWRLVRK